MRDYKSLLLILIGGLALFILFRQYIVILFIYLLCLSFMFRFGSKIVLDLDPVPFCTLLILYLYGPAAGFFFGAAGLLSIDAISGRFSMFTLVNLFSLLVTVTLFAFIIPASFILLASMMVFNVIRTAGYILLNLGLESIWFSAIHLAVYFVLGRIVSFFV